MRPFASELRRLIWLSLLPLLVACVGLVALQVRADRIEMQRSAERRLGVYLALVDGFVRARVRALEMLSRSPLADDPGSWARLYAHADDFRQTFGSHVTFADRERQMLFNTRVPFGTALPRLPDSPGRAAAPVALATVRPAVGDLVDGPIAGERLAAVAVPVVRAGRVSGLLLATMTTRELQGLLDTLPLQPGWLVHLRDGTGRLIARRAPADVDPGTDGDPAWRFEARFDFAPWTLAVEVTRDVARGALLRSGPPLAIAVALAALVGVLAARRSAGRIARQVASLSDDASPAAGRIEIEEIAATRRRLDTSLASLRASETSHRAMFDAHPHPIWVYDLQTLAFLAVNDAAVRSYGYSREEFLSMSIEDIRPADDVPRLLENVARVTTGHDDAGVWRHRTRDGRLIDVEITSHVVEYEGRRAELVLAQDVTARQRAVSALSVSRANLRLLIDHAPAGLAMFDRDMRYVAASRRWLIDYELAGWEIIGRSHYEVFPDLPERLTSAHRRALSGEVSRSERDCFVRPSGREMWLRWEVRPWYDAGGGIGGIVVFSEDITGLVEAEHARGRLDRRLVDLLDGMSDGFIGAGRDGRCRYVNEHAARMLGHATTELLGRRLLCEFPAASGDSFRDAWERAMNEGVGTRVQTRHAPSGRWFECRIYPADDEIAVFFTDITERRIAEEALRSRDLLLEEMGRIAHIGGWEFDPRTGQGTWTEEVARIHETDPERPVDVAEGMSYYRGEHRARLERAIRAAVDERTPYDLELELVTRGGRRKWVRTIGQPVVEDGEVVRVRGSFQDVTEHMRIEQALRDLSSALEERVAARTAELTAANRELDGFAYAVSHDLRAPLRAMSGFAEALREDYGDALDAGAMGHLDQIELASRRMSELIDGLLTLSRSVRGDLHQDRVDLSAVAHARLDQLSREEPARRAEFEVEPGLTTTGDARTLKSLMDNLIDNAWKYTAHADPARIRVYAAEVNGAPAVCVRDNGAGFDMAHAARLFQPFQRLHRQDEFPGIGIGLATAQRIARRHGGEITATASPGQGACFCFMLRAPDQGDES